MRKKQSKTRENYLEKKPVKKQGLAWNKDESGDITLEVENKGIMNRIAQKLIKKPKVSYIHLDETGACVWTLIDGEKSIYEIGEEVHKHFCDKAEPLYERLAQYFKILENYGFIEWK